MMEKISAPKSDRRLANCSNDMSKWTFGQSKVFVSRLKSPANLTEETERY